MIRRLFGCAAIFVASGIVVSLGAGEPSKAAKYTIKEVMQQAHKDGLLKKVLGGATEKKDREKLLELYASLWDNLPPKGGKPSWTEKTGALVVAAAKVALDQDGAAEALKTASNCKACHDSHK